MNSAPLDEWIPAKEAWRRGHISWIEYRAMTSRTLVSVYREIFYRWIRRKEIAWPDECQAFTLRFLQKHPRFSTSNAITSDDHQWRGAYLVNGRYAERLFGEHSSGALFTCLQRWEWDVKPKDRRKTFIEFGIRQILNECGKKT